MPGTRPELLVRPAKRERLYAPMVRFAIKPPPLVWQQQTRATGNGRALERDLGAGKGIWSAIRAVSLPIAPKLDGSRPPRDLRNICDSLLDAPACQNSRSVPHPPSTLGFWQKLDGFACDYRIPGKGSGYSRWHRTAIPKGPNR